MVLVVDRKAWLGQAVLGYSSFLQGADRYQRLPLECCPALRYGRLA